ncbi:AraC-like DNA-binding protein [Chryseobacterium defluvii]|uniref:AraC-like DNA-binding protein n=1 Tax=Chryseobacterium defluvii TaxID=160396 RepID=A0A840KH68_9FLAO|nr:helix-turn-helix transcriptional regulator [Chryseobacterium defluvii]MBB4806850.1 AraC-like DNA-binding protein [Chryseobacterium defluvii]
MSKNTKAMQMILVKKLLLILIFFIPIKIYLQEISDLKASREIDSLIKKDQWELAHFKLSNENIKFKRLSKYELNYDILIKLDSASALYRKGKYEESKKALLQTMNFIESNKNRLSLSNYEGLKHMGMTTLFYTEKRLGNVAQGLKYLSFFSRGISPVYIKKQRLYFAIAHIELGDYKKGIDLLRIRLNDVRMDTTHVLYNKIITEKEIATTYNTIADTYIKWYKDTGEKKFLDSSQINYEKAYSAVKKAPLISQYSKALHINRLANIALLKKQYKYSLSLYNICENDSSLMEKGFSREAIWLGKAENYTFLKKTDSAFYYIHKLYDEKADSKLAYDIQLKIYHLLSINYENLGDNKNAYKFAKLSLSEIQKKKVRDDSGNIFLGMYEQQQIKSISDEMLKENKKNILLLIALIVLTCSGIIFYAVDRQKKRKKKALLEIQKRQEKFNIANIDPAADEKTETPLIIEDELVNRILKKIELMESGEKFLSNKFKLANVAKQLNTNTAYLSQIINQHKGMSFSEYVNTLRIDYVLKELQENPKFRKYTIQTISEEVGYKSPTTFINSFKSRVNMTPSSYIKQLEKSGNTEE